MLALISLLMLVTLSITIVRIGATAFELTGLSVEVAAFQAQSAFSGAGFTTSESESIVNHPVRRKIARMLILVGSAGITTTIATFVLTFVGQSEVDIAQRGIYLLSGLLVIYIISRSKFLNNLLKKAIVKALSRNKTLLLHDYQEILGISKGYSITRLHVKKNNWVVGKLLKDLHLNQEGILVLALHRKIGDEEKFMIPTGETIFQAGDNITLYGRNESCKGLFERGYGKKGDQEHKDCCTIEEKLTDIREMHEGVAEVHE